MRTHVETELSGQVQHGGVTGEHVPGEEAIAHVTRRIDQVREKATAESAALPAVRHDDGQLRAAGSLARSEVRERDVVRLVIA